MIANAVERPTRQAHDREHARFLAALPRIEQHARIFFRGVCCPHRKADLIAEVRSLCWKWWRRLVKRGKDPATFVSTLATFAAKAVKSGRRLCGQLKPKDVLSERAQAQKSFVVGKLPDYSTLTDNPLAEALHGNTRTPPPDAAAFRCDFPAWQRTRTHRDRRIINRMMQGDRTQELSRSFGISPARVSQMRREFHDDWERFTDGEPLVNAAC
jgi:hypothetical protein